jgi:nucleotide-binding universal stress UspA family protein
MFATIMCATDGSAEADRALACAAHLASGCGSSLRVVHVARRPAGPGWRVVVDDEEALLTKLREQTVALRGRGLDAALHVIRGGGGALAEAIAVTARAVAADLVIVGTGGGAAAAGAALGLSTALISLAPCPVLAVPDRVNVNVKDLH